MARDLAPAASARPLRRDAELNRQRIIAAAHDIFGERGLEATLDDVAHHAGVGVGTVYRRFPSKEHLVEAMFVDQIETICKLAEEALRTEDPWQAFTDFTWRAAELHAGDRGLREVMLSNVFGHERVAEAKAQLVPLVTQLIERAQASGDLRPDVMPTDMPLLHQMIGSVIEFTHGIQPDLWRRCLALLLDGLRTTPGQATELPHPPLDFEALDEAMCSFRLPRLR
jgi:AcrR family transcriptional regulator